MVEVILAIGVFALTIVAVIGLLGPTAQQVRELQDFKVANTLPGPIREELNRLGFGYFVEVSADGTALKADAFPSSFSALEVEEDPDGDGSNEPYLVLFGTEDGSRVVVQSGAGNPVVTPNADVGSLSLADDERYFMVQIFPAEDNLVYQDGDAHVAFLVMISWPYKLPEMGSNDFVNVEDRSTFEYFTAIVVGEPF